MYVNVNSGSNLNCRLLDNSCHGNEHHGIDPNKFNSGHDDSSTKAVSLCTADEMQCCHMLAS